MKLFSCAFHFIQNNGANVTSKSVPRRAEEDEELKQPPKKKASNVASRLSENEATTEQNLH